MEAMEFLSIPKITKYSTFGNLNNKNKHSVFQHKVKNQSLELNPFAGKVQSRSRQMGRIASMLPFLPRFGFFPLYYQIQSPALGKGTMKRVHVLHSFTE